MSFPYITDIFNAAFGTHWSLPIPTFGIVVAVAVLTASSVAARMVRSSETLGALPIGSHLNISDIAVTATLAGIVGARVFDILDNLDRFLADPLSMILTRAGFSIYGGLCFGIIAGVVLVHRRSIPVIPMLDATAPAIMLGYGVGRIGCQMAGDGDWGIAANMALRPAWVPRWLWAQTYDGNIASVSIAPPGVYPTPIYETAMAIIIFWVLWRLSAHKNRAGYVFSVYLIAAGFERLLIEKIRINTRYDLLGVLATQAEAISFILVVAGLIGLLATIRADQFWKKVAVSIGVLSALTACAPR